MSETNTFNFKETFLNLTEYTVPFGWESRLEPYMPAGVRKDIHGNYFIQIGESETLFTSHLDTVGYKSEKVNHIIDGDIISTDGTTILGGDNKAGVTILMYLISQGVPGTYYFFVGEEVGCKGSRAALASDPVFFGQFKRAIAFDRRKTGSIITHQHWSRCCSDVFAESLAAEFAEQGMLYQADENGIFTDTAVFVDVIPECTNLSSGVWGEHTKFEYVNIHILKKIARAAAGIDWESLPAHRIIPSYFGRVA
jgi:hypothetical protein